ncbi:MAG TPA: ShlB/FhaC/HecB family hemolysin secretion/activation protein [Xanthobacteraceae bacterium]|nr:ShlB/FhaC/HecB family hemolysin secretion/activation protein [Xanthobacteraceae bacterium]
MALLAAGAVRAQDFKQVAPQEPKSAPAPTIAVPPEKPIVPPAVNKQLLPQLKGLRFVSSIKEIVRNGVNMPGVEVGKDLVLLNDAEIKDKLAGFLGKPLYTADLPRISQTVLDWYRAHQLPVVDVAFPAQDIAKGTVQAVVSVYKLGQIKVTGNEWFSSDVLEDEMQSEPGQPIDLATLKEDLNRLNRNPFRQVGAVLERSDTVGDTDIGLQVQDRLPLRVYASFDNEGLPVTGRDRYSTGLNWGNVLGLDQQFSYQFITSPDLWQTRDRGPGYSNDPRFTAHSASYTAPLPWGDTLNLFGTYVEQVPDLGANFGQVGQSVQLSGRYQMDLAPIGTLSQQLQFGFDYKRSNNDLSFGGTQVFANATNIEQFLLIYDGTRDDADGQTAVENQLVFSPGALSHGGTTAIYVASGVNGANAAYVYDNLQVTRVTYLPYALSSVLKLDGQLASTDLLPSEQLGAGGVDSVRGYSPRTANGTQGVLASIELRSPSYSPLGGVNGAIQDSGQLLAFFDSAFVSDLHDQAQQPKSASLESAGIGARYGIGRYFDVRFDYGWQLAKAPGAAKLGNLADVSVTLAY